MNLGLYRLLGVVLLFSIGSYAQPTASSLTLENIYNRGFFQAKSIGPIRWTSDGKGYTTLTRSKEARGQDILLQSIESDEKSILVSAKQLTPPGKNLPLTIADYNWSEDGTKLLVFTNTKEVWRYATRGDYWVFDLASGKLQQLGKSLPESSLMFAKLSPDEKKVAYVCGLNIYVETLATGELRQVTTDGGGSVLNGTFDWVYEEELNCRDGFRWSPDSEAIAYWQSNTKDVGTFYLINNLDSAYSKPIPIAYPKVGTPLSAVKIGVVSASGGTTKWFPIPGDPQNHYLARMDFIPNSHDVIIQQLNRQQSINRVWLGDTVAMKLTNILTEMDEAFLDIHDNLVWLENERSFAWTSERDGWRHLYKVSRDGKDVQLITSGNFDVVEVSMFDIKGGWVYYIASPENYTQRYLYRSRLDGKSNAERITPVNSSGQNSYQISPNAKWAIHTFSNTTTPPKYSLISIPAHKELKTLEDNRELKKRYDQLQVKAKEFLKVDLGEVILDAFMIKPVGFSPDKKYPVIFHVYGEAFGSTVQDVWGGEDLWHQYLAQQGYVVMSIDNRGTNVPRGRGWRKSIYGKVGILPSADQSKATAKLLQMYSFLDPLRVGIWGASSGGETTLNCLFRYPNVYKAGIAVSFVADQKLYDATYTERYLGLITEKANVYQETSVINFAKNLTGNLLLMHGTADDNVHYQNLEVLVDELIKHRKMFSMMAYPMREHSLSERANTIIHVRQTMERFWKQNL